MLSLKYKLTFGILLSNMIVLPVIVIISPMLLKKDFIKRAKIEHYDNFKNEIVDFRKDNRIWGTSESAILFSKESRKKQKLGGPPLNPNEGRQFLFGLVDNNGHVLMKFKEYYIGSKVPFAEYKNGEPLMYESEVSAYVLSNVPYILNNSDRSHLDILFRVIQFGIYVAFIISIIIGLILGNKITKNVRSLTISINSLKNGLDGQQVEASSNDEIGILAEAFNYISLDLKKTHDELKESNKIINKQLLELHELSIRDELTGLYNRRYFNEEMKNVHYNAKRYDHSFSLVLGDVDYFKKVNDNFSHLIGDTVLQNISSVILSNLRDSDTCARFGGEEIIFILPETESESAITITERIRIDIENYNWEEIAPGLKVTMSFGICSDYFKPLFKDMIADADKYLYKAKSEGRNRVVFK